MVSLNPPRLVGVSRYEACCRQARPDQALGPDGDARGKSETYTGLRAHLCWIQSPQHTLYLQYSCWPSLIMSGHWNGIVQAAQIAVSSANARATAWQGKLQATSTELDQLLLSSAQQAEVNSRFHNPNSPDVVSQQVGLISMTISVDSIQVTGVHQVRLCHHRSLSSGRPCQYCKPPTFPPLTMTPTPLPRRHPMSHFITLVPFNHLQGCQSCFVMIW